MRAVAGVLVFALLLWPLLGMALWSVLPVPMTPLMIQRSLSEAEWPQKSWLSHDRIPDTLRRAVLASEDQRFCEHSGFDWAEIGSAWGEYRSGRRLRGASTISMQTARTVFLWGGRDPVRKGLEAWYTVLLETFWSKNRILDVYLNTVEWGPGIYGAEAASLHYFGIPARLLHRSQAARLVAVLPNPRHRDPRRETGPVPDRAAWVDRQVGAMPVRNGRVCP